MKDGVVDRSKETKLRAKLESMPEDHIGEVFVFNAESLLHDFSRWDGHFDGWYGTSLWFSTEPHSVSVIIEKELVVQLLEIESSDLKDITVLGRVVKCHLSRQKEALQILAVTRKGPPKIDVRYQL